jgi:hypothetical protein
MMYYIPSAIGDMFHYQMLFYVNSLPKNCYYFLAKTHWRCSNIHVNQQMCSWLEICMFLH